MCIVKKGLSIRSVNLQTALTHAARWGYRWGGTVYSESIQVESVDQEHCIAIWNSVIISVWRSEPTATRLKKLVAIPTRLARLTAPYAIIVVEERCAVPDDEGRATAIRFIQELRENGGKGIVLVFEGAGFLAAASRAVMLGLMTASRVAVPYKVQQTAVQAEEFFRSEDPTGPFTHGRLVRAVETVRSQIRDSSPSKPVSL